MGAAYSDVSRLLLLVEGFHIGEASRDLRSQIVAVPKPVLPTRADRCKNGEHDASAELLHGYKTHRSFRPRLLKRILFLCFLPSTERLNLNPLVAGRATQLLNACVVAFAWPLHWPDTDRSLVGNRQIIADMVVVVWKKR